MEGALILPSEEDNNTFSINFSSGEVYKVRAAEAKERQVWVDKLRACSNGTANSQKTFVRSVMSPSSHCGNFGSLPSPAEALNRPNDLLLLKATCSATGQCLETAFTLLQDLSTATRDPGLAPSRIKNTGN